MRKYLVLAAKLAVTLAVISGCTKSRRAELPEDQQAGIFAISEFGDTTSNSEFGAQISTASSHLLASDVSVPARMKFMFSNLPLLSQDSKNFKITFSVDRQFVTAYKVATKPAELSTLEKAIAMTTAELQLTAKAERASTGQMQQLAADQNKAQKEKEEIKSGKKEGALLVPLFKYGIKSYGILKRAKNELKEDTSKLELKSTEWKDATHIQIEAQTDNREVVGMSVEQATAMRRLFPENQLNNQLMTAAELQSRFSVGMNFIENSAQVFTRLDANVMRVYQVTSKDKLNERQRRLLQNGNQEIISCQDELVARFVNSTDANCVLVLKADVPVAYKTAKLTPTDESGRATSNIQFAEVSRAQSVGLVEIKENIAAKQVDLSGALDPASTVKLSDLKGEFFYRRTFESASNMFLGRAGTSGDMTIIEFELEDNRIVVRNRQSLITYTGQGAKDREELMSFPVKYIRMQTTDASGAKLTVPQGEQTTKENAEYASIDWTTNSIPDAHSPLAFYDGGACIRNTTSLQVTDTDMRLATDGVLNYSLSGSYTVNADKECAPEKEVNSAYWGGTFQYNFNIKERISFMKKKDPQADVQFAQNISGMAQAAFNYGVFTLADKVTDNGTLSNRDGSEKYMPLIHDFRNGKKIKYHVGGLNNPEATPPARRQLMIDATKQVIEEWNRTLRYAFKNTPLERDGDFVDVEFDNADADGHLGDLDRNYIWYNELPAENGLLGVAQPAANPRSGTIQSANVIIYSGNTMDQIVGQLKMTELARSYEKLLAENKAAAIAEMNKPADPALPASAEVRAMKAPKAAALKIKSTGRAISHKKLSLDLFRNRTKGKSVNYGMNEETYIQKMMDFSAKTHDRKKMELEMNKAIIQFGGLDGKTKAALTKHSQMLAAAIRFNEANANRPGCFSYERDDINDAALVLSKDPEENKMLNFKKSLMSTLSHELGHAFGLLHNFKASTDRPNYEFPEDKKNPTGRNYSSIMDYMPDIDMNYQGPGPYDAHALRAAYTDMVEAADGITLLNIPKLLVANKITSMVHLRKDSLNRDGLLKYYEQCDDGGLEESALCAQFDTGGSASEIVTNLIRDYSRSYKTRNFVYDKINFGGEQKEQVVTRTISLFQNIRSFLDEAVNANNFGTGRPDDDETIVKADLANAAKLGYIFFHELLRTPDAPQMSAKGTSNRLVATPYEYLKKGEDGKDEKVKDVRIIERRSFEDLAMTPDKLNTIGIGLDRVFAMSFLLQSTTVKTDSDSRQSNISYLDFEQWFLEIDDPAISPIMNAILDVLSNKLKAGFFAPSRELRDLQFQELDIPVASNRHLTEQAALATVVSLAENKWDNFDPFAEMFKVSKSSVGQAPDDRPNAVKAGSDRNLSDTKVYFASQNAQAAGMIVDSTATNEYYVGEKESLQAAMKALIDPKSRASAAKALVKKLHADNTRGQVIRADWDNAASPRNLEKQVAALKSIIVQQFAFIDEMKTKLENTKKEDMKETIGKIKAKAKEIKAVNDSLLDVPLLAMAFTFVVEQSAGDEFTLQNGDKLTADVLAELLVTPGTNEADLDNGLDVLEKLSMYSALVDPDTIGK